MGQNNPVTYAQAIQATLSDIFDVPVYANFNRNYATESSLLLGN
jgi:hypothetical protein